MFNHNRFPFKRTTATFTGDTDWNGDGLCRNHGSTVTIIGHVGTDEDDDVWQVRFDRDGQTHRVIGDDLTPHPEAPETNVEAITRLMENGSTVMVQAFILEGAMKYAESVLADEDATRAAMANGFIGAQTWIDTAKEVQDFIGQHLKPKR